MKIYVRIVFFVYCICLIINPAAAVQNIAVDAPPKGVDIAWPVAAAPIDINQDAEITLRWGNKKPVSAPDCAGRLTALSSGKAHEFKTKLTADGAVLVPAAVLQAVYKDGIKSFLTRPVELRVKLAAGWTETVRLCLYDSKVSPDFKEGKVKSVSNQPYFFLGGERVPRFNGRLSWLYKKILGKANRQFAEAGIHWNIACLAPYEYMTVKNGGIVFDRKAFLQEFYRVIAWMVAEDPKAVVNMYWYLLMPAECQKLKPEEMVKLDTGGQYIPNRAGMFGKPKCLQPSYASKYWREYAGKVLRETIAEIRRSPWADRIATLRLLYGNGGEWNHWGYHQKALVDFSKPMQRAFGKWLNEKYKTEAALQKAWGKPGITFNSDNLVPARKERLIGKGPFRLGGTAVQSSVDYYEFFQEYTVKTIEHFAKISKKASDGKLLTGSYYGYYWGHLGNSPYHFQDAGSYGLKYINQSPWIDFVGGPGQYTKRNINLLLNGISESLALHGKIWEDESDTRTHHSSGRKEYGVTDNLSESLAVLRRNYSILRSGKATAYLYDFMCDWYQDTEFIDTFARLKRIDDFLLTRKAAFPKEVAVIVSEEVIPHLSSIRSEALTALQRNMFFKIHRIGIPFDMYLESDLKKLRLDDYKYYIFINSFYVSDDTLNIIRNKVMKNKRKVLFLYAPGVISNANEYDFKRSKELTGIGIRPVPGGSSDTVFLRDTKIKTGGENKVTPQFCISDPGAKVFAVFADGKAAGAMRKTADYTSAVLCVPAPDHLFLRAWLKSLGAKCYQEKGDAVCYFTGALMTVYSNKKGIAVMRMPPGTEIAADFMSERTIGPNPTKIGVELNRNGLNTRMFYVGSREGWFEFNNPRVKRYYTPENSEK
jgi:hypothetical protein